VIKEEAPTLKIKNTRQLHDIRRRQDNMKMLENRDEIVCSERVSMQRTSSYVLCRIKERKVLITAMWWYTDSIGRGNHWDAISGWQTVTVKTKTRFKDVGSSYSNIVQLSLWN